MKRPLGSLIACTNRTRAPSASEACSSGAHPQEWILNYAHLCWNRTPPEAGLALILWGMREEHREVLRIRRD